MFKRLLSIVAVLSLAMAMNIQAQTFKISTLYPDGTAVLVELKKAAKDIEAKTEGRVKFKFYPGGVMGDDNAVFRKIKIGQLHGALTQGGAVARFYKDSQIYNVPIGFRTYGEVDYVRERMDEGIIKGLEENGWITFGLVDGGFAYTMTNAPVKSVGDLRQQKLWLPANDPASEKAAEAFELSPIVLNIGEVLTSLSTGAINAIAAPPAAALALQWYSKVTHMTDLPLLYTYGLLAIDKRHFGKLSAADQQIVRDELGKVFKDLDALSRKDNIDAFEALKNQKIQIVQPEETDLAEWRDYAEKATADLVTKGEFSQKILDELNGHLADYRAQQK